MAIPIVAVAASPTGSQVTSALGLPTGDSVSIRADAAWEDERPGIVHFSGHFLLKAAEWSVSAEKATLYGDLDDPDVIVLEGSPAHVLVQRQAKGVAREVSASAPQIEYQRQSRIIKMTGGAELREKQEVLHSDEIEYDIEHDRYRAGGAEGIFIEVAPGD